MCQPGYHQKESMDADLEDHSEPQKPSRTHALESFRCLNRA